MAAEVIKILLIEDNPGDIRLVREMLTEARMGIFDLHYGRSLKEGFEQLENPGGFSIILLDLSLPDSQGLHTLEHAQQRAFNLPIVLLTGLEDESVAVSALQKGAQDYLIKGQVNSGLLERSILYAIERKVAEERIREQAALIDIAPNAVIVRDLQDHIVYWSKGAENLYGWRADEILGRDGTSLIYKKRTSIMEDAFKSVVENGEWTGELEQVAKDGREIIVESRRVLVRDAEGRPKSQLIVNTDITERKKLAAQFLRAQRMESIGTLAGGIAHDLNNALTPIAVAIQILEDKFRDDDTRQCLNIIKSCVTRSSDMVKQVLSFVRGVEGERVTIQLKHMINELRKVLQQTLSKSIIISTTTSKDLWPVNGDPTQLYQVLMNLSVNARDAMPEGGQLRIKAENILMGEQTMRLVPDARPGRYVVITVADTGSGMPAEIVDKIFEPFFTTKEIGKGTGLGLSTALGIVKSHSGFIDVMSQVGEGTEFKIYLPADETFSAMEREHKTELSHGKGELILVVDDEILIRDITKSTLESYGYEVMTASDGTEAISICAKHIGKIKLVLMDMMMPFLDGTATIRTLEKLDPTLRIVPTSGLMTKAELGETSPCVIGFLPKPYTAENLLDAVSKAIK